MACGDVPLILASESPRRRELLRQTGYRFLVQAAPVDEDAVDPSLSPAAYVESLAYLKTRVAIEFHGLRAGLVLGADTAVELGGRMIGKPADEADARRILAGLSGSVHHVLTGLALVDVAACRRWLAHDSTAVRMRPMAAEEIAAYVASGEAMGKAGAYALQETGDRYVESIQGSWTNVVGLPMELLERMLKATGYEPSQFKS
jgi:septum formation protein